MLGLEGSPAKGIVPSLGTSSVGKRTAKYFHDNIACTLKPLKRVGYTTFLPLRLHLRDSERNSHAQESLQRPIKHYPKLKLINVFPLARCARLPGWRLRRFSAAGADRCALSEGYCFG